jgi:hypothetical protein
MKVVIPGRHAAKLCAACVNLAACGEPGIRLCAECQMEAAKETVIVVHGTFAAPKPGASQWYQLTEGLPPTKGFIAELDAALQERACPARCWAHCGPGDHGFHWSGKNSWVERTRAASELGKYVLNLRKEGWCCHIVAHSHGGNVVLEAMHQITTAVPSNAPLGKIVTLGTPFMDTMSPILQRIAKNSSFLAGLSWIALVWVILSPAIGWALMKAFGVGTIEEMSTTVMLSIMSTFLASALVFALLVFGRKSQAAEHIFNRADQMHPKLLAIGSRMDEPWQILHHLRNYPNPMAVETNLIRYLISSMRSHISRSGEVSRIYEVKSYRDLKWGAKLFLALNHVMVLSFLFSMLSAMSMSVYFTVDSMIRYGDFHLYMFQLTPEQLVILFIVFVGWFVLILLFTRMFGPAFYSAFLSPFRWCAYRFGAIKGIFREIATYVVRSRGWSVFLAIAMGLEGYRHPLPRIERYPSSVPGNFVIYENMPMGAQQRALARRGAWIDRHLNNAAQTFSKLVVTSADITLLQRAIEADQTLVHAAYYSDPECIARIADWIAAKDDMTSNATFAGSARSAA